VAIGEGSWWLQQQQIKPQSTKIRNKETKQKNTIEKWQRIRKERSEGVDYVHQISSGILDPSDILFILFILFIFFIFLFYK